MENPIGLTTIASDYLFVSVSEMKQNNTSKLRDCPKGLSFK